MTDDRARELTDDDLLGVVHTAASAGLLLTPDLVDQVTELFVWRDVDSELAEILEDSATEATTGLRSNDAGDGARTVAFGTAEMRIDVELAGDGVVVVSADDDIVSCTIDVFGGGVETSSVDAVAVGATGSFRAALPAGARFRLRLGRESGGAVVTDWAPLSW